MIQTGIFSSSCLGMQSFTCTVVLLRDIHSLCILCHLRRNIIMYDFKLFEMSFSQYSLFTYTCKTILQQIPFKCPKCTMFVLTELSQIYCNFMIMLM